MAGHWAPRPTRLEGPTSAHFPSRRHRCCWPDAARRQPPDRPGAARRRHLRRAIIKSCGKTNKGGSLRWLAGLVEMRELRCHRDRAGESIGKRKNRDAAEEVGPVTVSDAGAHRSPSPATATQSSSASFLGMPASGRRALRQRHTSHRSGERRRDCGDWPDWASDCHSSNARPSSSTTS